MLVRVNGINPISINSDVLEKPPSIQREAEDPPGTTRSEGHRCLPGWESKYRGMKLPAGKSSPQVTGVPGGHETGREILRQRDRKIPCALPGQSASTGFGSDTPQRGRSPSTATVHTEYYFVYFQYSHRSSHAAANALDPFLSNFREP